MSPGTTEWLRLVARLADKARNDAAGGCDLEATAKRYAHEAVEVGADFEQICDDLGLGVPATWSEKQSRRYSCEIEAHRFCRKIIDETMGSVA